VNLDEVLPHAGSKPLPVIHITTRPMSAPPVPRNGVQPLNGRASSNNTSRAGTPVAGAPAPGNTRRGVVAQLGLGPKPQLDERRIEELLSPTPGMCLVVEGFMGICAHCMVDQLSLLPLASLEACLSDLRTQTQNTSALLTYLLQTKDALQQDSETYNRLIAELVGEAQKMKNVGSGTPSRRGSGIM
jgi:hypothetical protein